MASPNKAVKPFAALTRTFSTPHLLAHGFAIVARSGAPYLTPLTWALDAKGKGREEIAAAGTRIREGKHVVH